MKPTQIQTSNFYNYQPPQNDAKFVIKCVLAIILIVSGMLSILFFNSALSGSMRIIAGLILFPKTIVAFERVIGFKFNRIIKYAGITLLVQGSFIISYMNIMHGVENQNVSNKQLSGTGTIEIDTISQKPDGLLTEEQLEQRNLKRMEVHKKQLDEFEGKYLSGWDGSFRPLVNYVKSGMNDPDSFEHVETKFWIINNQAILSMKFRGKNDFGAKVVNVVKAKVSLDGKIIRLMTEN